MFFDILVELPIDLKLVCNSVSDLMPVSIGNNYGSECRCRAPRGRVD